MHIDTYFTSVYEMTKRQVHAYLTAKCALCEDVDDLFQDTYTELYSLLKRRGIGYIREPEAFVISIAKQRLSRHYRKAALRRHCEVESPVMDDGSEVELDDIESLSVEEIVCEKMDVEQIRTLVCTYGVETERIIRLYFVEGLTIAEIAQLTATSESNVKNRIYRTLKRIRNEITKGEL